ncbi:hypothetical protein D3869_27125 (plasmid) [Azospirillum brasilense]|uniref:CopL family metal-binding regulatory protein n=2 Tax=Azospirillum brasilense TaxID=192 RepID=A0A4D8R7N8_AZOBR|nr:hypothetical protein D3869_27125 [Azospirillum brasilense]
MARGGCTLVGSVPMGRLMAALLLLAALALFAPSPAQAHIHAGAHGQNHAASSASPPANAVWMGDADHAPPSDDACAGRNGLSCGGACPMMLSGIAATAAFPTPPLRASAPFRPTGLLPEGIGPPPALRPPRLAV